MIVVAIIGILAAVAVPYYQRYIAKARFTAKILPAARIIQDGVATNWSLNTGWHSANSSYATIKLDGDMSCIKTDSFADGVLTFTVDSATHAKTCSGLNALSNQIIIWTAQTSPGIITGWALSGTLATTLGLSNEK